MVSGSPDVSQFMCLPVAIHLSPSLAGGVQLFVFTCLASSPSLAGGVRLSRCLPIHLSPSASSWCPALAFVSQSGWWCPDLWMSFLCFHVSLIMCLSPRVSQFYACLLICLQASVCLSLLVVVSGSFACSLLCVFHHLSLTFCLVVHLSPKSCVSNHMSALVAVSCSIVLWFLLCFVFVLVLYSLCVFLFSQDKVMFHHVFFLRLPLVSHLSPTLSPSYCLRYCTNAVAKNRNRVAWEMLLVCDSFCSRLTWIKHCQHQELV